MLRAFADGVCQVKNLIDLDVTPNFADEQSKELVHLTSSLSRVLSIHLLAHFFALCIVRLTYLFLKKDPHGSFVL